MTCICDLPLELQEKIALDSPEAWWAMLCVPDFGRHSVHVQDRAEAAFKTVDEKGWTYFAGKIHSFNDRPSKTYHSSSPVAAPKRDARDVHLYNHRRRLRASEVDDSTKFWYKSGKVLSQTWYSDGAACPNKEWHRHGLLHRDGGKPSIIRTDGTKSWHTFGVQYTPGDESNKDA